MKSIVTRNTHVINETLAFTVHSYLQGLSFEQNDRYDKNNLPRICDLGGTEI